MPVIVLLAFFATGQLQPVRMGATAETAWLDPRTPSCQVYKARVQQLKADMEEIDFILRRLSGKRALSRPEIQELEEAVRRQARLERESKSQKLAVKAVFSWPADFKSDWVTQRNYRLSVTAPGLDWQGFDAREPKPLSLNADASGLRVEFEIPLADYCASPSRIQIILTELLNL